MSDARRSQLMRAFKIYLAIFGTIAVLWAIGMIRLALFFRFS